MKFYYSLELRRIYRYYNNTIQVLNAYDNDWSLSFRYSNLSELEILDLKNIPDVIYEIYYRNPFIISIKKELFYDDVLGEL